MADTLYEAVVGETPQTQPMNTVSARETRAAEQERQSFERAKRGHENYIERANKYERFYEGDQWEEKDLQKLKAEQRPALTINKILSTINTIKGEQVARRMDITFKNRTAGAEANSFARTKLAMAIADENDYDYAESEMFSDGLILDRGYIDVRMDWDESPLGKVTMDRLDPRMVIPDPDMQTYDSNKWQEVTVMEWKSLSDIELQYGKDKADRIGDISRSKEFYDKDNFNWELPGGTKENGTDDEEVSDKEEKKRLRSVLLRHRQFWQNTKVFCLVDPATGETRQLPLKTKPEEAKMLGQAMGYPIYSKVIRKVRWRVVADKVLLHDDWSPYKTFTVIPYFCYFRPGRPFGAVANLISPQEQLNKLNSQELHIVNSTANSGWMIPKGSLTNMTADDLAKDGAKTGLVLEYNQNKGVPAKIDANSIPTGIDRISLKSEVHIKEISGITDALLGLESAEVSGVALQSKEKRGQVQIQSPLDNLARTRKLVGRKLLELIRDFYTDERVVAITQDDQPGQPRDFMPVNTDQTNDLSFGEDDVVISSVPARDLLEDTQFAQLIQMKQVGINVPDYRIAQNSQLQHRAEIAEELKALQGLTPPSEEEQQIAQLRQQLALAMEQGEVAKLEAEVAELHSQTQLNRAKAESASAEDERQFRELENRFAMKSKELDLRKQLSALSSASKLDAIQAQGMTNLRQSIVSAQLDKQKQGTENHGQNS